MTLRDDRNEPDLLIREAEQEIEDLPFGPPSPVSDALREFMRDIYAARAIEKAAQSGRCEGMKLAPVTPGVGIPIPREKAS
jgi:hypothetical protein